MLTDRFFPSVSTFLTPNPWPWRRRRTCAARDQTRQGQRTAQVSAARDRHGSSARGFRVASGRCRRRVKEAAIADQGMQRRLTAAPVVERLFRLCGKGIGLGDSQGGRQNIRFATSLRVLAGGLILSRFWAAACFFWATRRSRSFFFCCLFFAIGSFPAT